MRAMHLVVALVICSQAGAAAVAPEYVKADGRLSCMKPIELQDSVPYIEAPGTQMQVCARLDGRPPSSYQCV
jgi:hypothetical protein